MSKHFISLLLTLLSLTSVQPQGLPVPTQPPIPNSWSEAQQTIYPNPRGSPDKCRGPADSADLYICDPNGVLSDPKDVTRINTVLLQLRKNTPGGRCLCGSDIDCGYTGVPVAVAIMSNFEPAERQNVTMASYADFFFGGSWKFQTCNDGIIIVIGNNSNPKVYTKFGDKFKERLGEVFRNQSQVERCLSALNSSTQKLFEERKFLEAVQKQLNISEPYRDLLDGKIMDCNFTSIFSAGSSIQNTLSAMLLISVCQLLRLILRSVQGFL